MENFSFSGGITIHLLIVKRNENPKSGRSHLVRPMTKSFAPPTTHPHSPVTVRESNINPNIKQHQTIMIPHLDSAC